MLRDRVGTVSGAAVIHLLPILLLTALAGGTVIIAIHDVNLLAEVAGRVVILAGGTIAADGSAEKILTDGALLRAHGYGLPEVVTVASALRLEGRIDARPIRRLSFLDPLFVPSLSDERTQHNS